MPRRDRAHTHRCTSCNLDFECHADLSRNYDGWPEVVCDQYHIGNVTVCEECYEQAKQRTAADLKEQDEEESTKTTGGDTIEGIIED